MLPICCVAAAIAYESANHLQGASRDLAFSVVHMIDMAKAMVDRSLEGEKPKRKALTEDRKEPDPKIKKA
jgi:hypothetical protein